jgi:hypothetical protein
MKDYRYSTTTVRGTLGAFQTMRNKYVQYALLRSGKGKGYDNGMQAAIVKGAVQRSGRYIFLFPADTTTEAREAKLSEVFDVATILRTAAETVESATSSQIMTRGGHTHELSITGEKEAVLDAKLDAVASRFTGVTALEALALLCGYSIDEVMNLTDDDIHAAYGFVVASGIQLPWWTLMHCVTDGVDASIVSSMLAV